MRHTEARHYVPTPQRIEHIRHMAEVEGMSINDIGNALGMHEAIVLKIEKKNGIKFNDFWRGYGHNRPVWKESEYLHAYRMYPGDELLPQPVIDDALTELKEIVKDIDKHFNE